MFRRVLIANRGEIAVRLIRACQELGIATVAVHSEADAAAPHAVLADHAVCIGPAPATESYLDIPRLIEAARATGADAIHPGYGFLAENAGFARAAIDAGLTFIGPRPDAIAAMGDKIAARRRVAAAGVPVVPAVEDVADAAAAAAAVAQVGFPLLIKAAAGGGGKGMRVVRRPDELDDAFAAAGREAGAAFANSRLFLERYLERPRHVEIQVLADHHGHIVHLGERECSVQRRHQKIIEESPSPALTPALRDRMAAAAMLAAQTVDYVNAGTVEFLLEPGGQFYFLEMNTRLQVEHPVTELVTGIDMVHAQLRVAAGEPLWLTQADIHPTGHAIECRVYAEDPAQRFLPSPGTILQLREPHGPGIRVDSGVRQGFSVPVHYDPLLAKVAAWSDTRETARHRLVRALRDYVVLGCTTNVAFLIDVLEHPAFAAGDTHTHFVDAHFPAWQGRTDDRLVAAIVAALDIARTHRTGPSRPDPLAEASPWVTLGTWRLSHGSQG